MNYTFKSIIIHCLIVITIIGCSTKDTKSNAVDYNNEIVLLNDEVVLALNKYNRALEQGDIESISSSLSNFQEVAKKNDERFAKLGVFNDEKMFSLAAAAIFNYYNNSSTSEYDAITAIFIRDTISTEEHQNMLQLVKKTKVEYISLRNNFLIGQNAFAEKYDFLIEN